VTDFKTERKIFLIREGESGMRWTSITKAANEGKTGLYFPVMASSTRRKITTEHLRGLNDEKSGI
jgi:hypothetical protein